MGEAKEEFWTSVEECLDGFKKSERLFLIGDMNGKVGERKVDGVVGGWGVQSDVDGNGSTLEEVVDCQYLLPAQNDSQAHMESGVEEGGGDSGKKGID